MFWYIVYVFIYKLVENMIFSGDFVLCVKYDTQNNTTS
jgi:hypothetical protein